MGFRQADVDLFEIVPKFQILLDTVEISLNNIKKLEKIITFKFSVPRPSWHVLAAHFFFTQKTLCFLKIRVNHCTSSISGSWQIPPHSWASSTGPLSPSGPASSAHSFGCICQLPGILFEKQTTKEITMETTKETKKHARRVTGKVSPIR